MLTTFEITDQILFNRHIEDVDTCRLICTNKFGRRNDEFLATGDLFIKFKNEDWSTHSGDFFSDDYKEYGFQLIPKL